MRKKQACKKQIVFRKTKKNKYSVAKDANNRKSPQGRLAIESASGTGQKINWDYDVIKAPYFI